MKQVLEGDLGGMGGDGIEHLRHHTRSCVGDELNRIFRFSKLGYGKISHFQSYKQSPMAPDH